MIASPSYLAMSTFRSLSSCLVVRRPAYRLLTTTVCSQAKAAPQSAPKLDTLSILATKAPKAKSKPAQSQAEATPRSATKASAKTKAPKVEPKPPKKQQVKVLKKKAPKVPPKPLKKPELKGLVPPKLPKRVSQLVVRDVLAAEKLATGDKLTRSQIIAAFRLAGEKYRSLSDQERKSYQAEEDRLRQEYKVEMRQFLDSLTPQDYANQQKYIRRRRAQGKSTSALGIPKSDPNAPKKAPPAFFLFYQEARANPAKFSDFPGFPNTETTICGQAKALSAYWREMKDDAKKGYVLESKRLHESWKQARAQYASQNGLEN